MRSFSKNIGAAKTFPEMEEIVREAIGPSELMEFMRMDLGAFLRKRIGTEGTKGSLGTGLIRCKSPLYRSPAYRDHSSGRGLQISRALPGRNRSP